MSTTKEFGVALPSDWADRVRHQVTSGAFTPAGDMLRDGVPVERD